MTIYGKTKLELMKIQMTVSNCYNLYEMKNYDSETLAFNEIKKQTRL